jgi:ubiquinone/menaquinone biosynthesis C-methylase UbiE
MRELNLLEGYPQPKEIRYVGENIRTINHRIIAAYRDKEFFDGDRNCGYGGYKYDGRWKKVATKIKNEYQLDENASFLQLNCEKGFLLNDILEVIPKSKLYGLETSKYAVDQALERVKSKITKVDNYYDLKFKDNSFDFILGLGVVYIHSLQDAIRCLKEIQRVGKGKSFITLASYNNENDYWLFKNWTVLGSLILKKDEWLDVLKHVKYTGDYFFTNADTLKLKRK